jgi:small-conductance mechanosensitive channel
MLARLIRFLCLALVLLVGAGPATALDEAVLLRGEMDARQLQTELGRLTILPRNTASAEALQKDRAALADLRTKAKVASDTLAPSLAELAKQIEQLGPPPEQGSTESEALAKTRASLKDQSDRLAAVGKQFDLVALEAEQAEARLTVIQREQFLQRIFTMERSILDPRLWWDAISGGVNFTDILRNRASTSWLVSQTQRQPLALLVFPLGMILVWLLGLKLAPALMQRLVGEGAPQGRVLSGLNRLWRAAWGAVKWSAAIFIGFLLATLSLTAAGFLPGIWEDIFTLVAEGVSYALVAGGLLYFVCAPGQPERRLIAIDDKAARTLPVIAGIIAFFDAAGESLSELATKLNMPVSFVVSLSAIIALIIVVLLALALSTIRKQAAKNLAAGEMPYFLIWALRFMPLFWLLLLLALLALGLGYVALSYFVASNLFTTALLVVAFGMAHALSDAFSTALTDQSSSPGALLRRVTGWTEGAISRLALLVRTISDIIIVTVAVTILVGMWTDVLFDTASIFTAARDGFHIGDIAISPTTLAIGALVLIAGVVLTRSVTRWLDRRVLSETLLDTGVKNSIHSAAIYSGYGLAAILALTSTGVDFSSLALAFGALGFGIGFGLQSIANNFVSGLILLAERPVRVGDWVATNAGEGIVKKINVRSTEIETFDNCTIIVPNSNLISEAVRNWTHRDTVGRFTVSVSVAHGTDAKTISKTLLELAQNHPQVMRHPAPFVQLSRISPLSLDFDLRGYTRHVFDAANIASDLRMAIAGKLPRKTLLLNPPPPAGK